MRVADDLERALFPDQKRFGRIFANNSESRCDPTNLQQQPNHMWCMSCSATVVSQGKQPRPFVKYFEASTVCDDCADTTSHYFIGSIGLS